MTTLVKNNMFYTSILVFGCFTLSVNGQNFLQYFAKQNIVFCTKHPEDRFQEDILESIIVGNVWIKNWNCFNSELPQVHDSLMILKDIKSQDLHRIFALHHIQNSLSSNIWIIMLGETRTDVSEFFNQNYLKIGLNAQIFVIQSSNVIQIIGTATYRVEYKVSYLQYNQIHSFTIDFFL